MLYDRKGDHDRAIREFDNVLALDSAKPLLSETGHCLAYINRGVAHFNRGEFDLAIADASNAIGYDQKFSYAYYNRGLAYRMKGEFGPAIADFDKAIEINPSFAYSYFNRGLAHRGNGEFGLAIADFQKTIEVDHKFAAANAELGKTIVEAGKAALARLRNWVMGG